MPLMHFRTDRDAPSQLIPQLPSTSSSLHSQLVPSLPLYREGCSSTPYIHTVHHSSNTPYLDKNHGDASSPCQDRLYRHLATPHSEGVVPKYRASAACPDTDSPIAYDLFEFEETWKAVKKAPGLKKKNKFMYIFRPSGMEPRRKQHDQQAASGRTEAGQGRWKGSAGAHVHPVELSGLTPEFLYERGSFADIGLLWIERKVWVARPGLATVLQLVESLPGSVFVQVSRNSSFGRPFGLMRGDQ